ncbi:hypothetical protein TNCV_1276451 [Trichonephila clavipes]|nr:hypothetical protein TNCV_1276451 [Trichonephila clavipes]
MKSMYHFECRIVVLKTNPIATRAGGNYKLSPVQDLIEKAVDGIFLVSSPLVVTPTLLSNPYYFAGLGAEWLNPVVFHSPSKAPFCFSLEPIKSHFLLLSSIKTGLGSQSPHRHGGRARISSIPDPIPGSESL